MAKLTVKGNVNGVEIIVSDGDDFAGSFGTKLDSQRLVSTASNILSNLKQTGGVYEFNPSGGRDVGWMGPDYRDGKLFIDSNGNNEHKYALHIRCSKGFVCAIHFTDGFGKNLAKMLRDAAGVHAYKITVTEGFVCAIHNPEAPEIEDDPALIELEYDPYKGRTKKQDYRGNSQVSKRISNAPFHRPFA